MSLLLDALKKAAQEKEKASQGEPDTEQDKPAAQPESKPEVDEVPDELELELDNFEYPEESVDEPAVELADESIETKESPGTDALDALPELSQEIEVPKSDIVESATNTETETIAEPETEAQELAAETSDIQPAVNKVPVDASPSVIETPPELETDRPADYAVTQNVSARDALDAMIHKTRVREEKRNKQLIIAGSLLLLVVLIATGLYYYFEAQDEIEQLKRNQLIARQSVPQKQPVDNAVVMTQANKPDVTVKPKAVAAFPQKSTPKPRQSVASVKPPEKNNLAIIRKSVEDPIDVLLNRAYELFTQGQYDQANALYMKVLNREANNRDALLGTAAVALKQQHYEVARQKYSHLLQLDPNDSIARAGIANIEAEPRDESRLKIMIREQPQAAHLYFALGSLYARQDRWPEAQQAFFSAWSGNNTNPDYAYNLAVSLDQLGKYRQAKSFYTLTLKLGNAHNSEFSREDIEARIKRLESLEHG